MRKHKYLCAYLLVLAVPAVTALILRRKKSRRS